MHIFGLSAPRLVSVVQPGTCKGHHAAWHKKKCCAGSNLKGASLQRMICKHGVTGVVGGPTLFTDLLQVHSSVKAGTLGNALCLLTDICAAQGTSPELGTRPLHCIVSQINPWNLQLVQELSVLLVS